ncbi:hypothetical protein L6452_09312 [Arctium lappa]|uniref:Uncharacterized protein n=1 Tax=Arctium lappa TaxID=4217 RepID=A0ACB9DK52_ARCLA|nr:hypothetical protein L6452_09312 [Arctium lappa]
MTNEGDDFSSNDSSNTASDDDVEVTNAPPTNMSSMPGNEEPSTSEPMQRSTKTRGVTLLTKIRNSDDCIIQFCPDTGRPIDAYSSKYANWVGLEARSKISILVPDWHKVDADEKARLWAPIKQKWNIEEDDRLKKKTMSIASNSWRSFKSMLVKSYVRKNKTSCSKYTFAKPNTWDKFVKLKSTPEFEGTKPKKIASMQS